MRFACSDECYFWYFGNCSHATHRCPFSCEPNQAPQTFCGTAQHGSDFPVYFGEGPYYGEPEGTQVVGGNVSTDNCYETIVCISSDVVEGTGGGEDNEDGMQFCDELEGFAVPHSFSCDFPGDECPVEDWVNV